MHTEKEVVSTLFFWLVLNYVQILPSSDIFCYVQEDPCVRETWNCNQAIYLCFNSLFFRGKFVTVALKARSCIQGSVSPSAMRDSSINSELVRSSFKIKLDNSLWWLGRQVLGRMLRPRRSAR